LRNIVIKDIKWDLPYNIWNIHKH